MIMSHELCVGDLSANRKKTVSCRLGEIEALRRTYGERASDGVEVRRPRSSMITSSAIFVLLIFSTIAVCEVVVFVKN